MRLVASSYLYHLPLIRITPDMGKFLMCEALNAPLALSHLCCSALGLSSRPCFLVFLWISMRYHMTQHGVLLVLVNSLPHRTTRKNSYKLLIGLGDKVLWSSIAIQDLPIIRWDDHVLASCCNCLYIGNWKQVIILYDNILDNILKD